VPACCIRKNYRIERFLKVASEQTACRRRAARAMKNVMDAYLISAAIGLVSGITSGLFGVGGGVVMVPAMILLMKMNPKMAIGTSLAVIIPTALMGSYKHYTQGNVNWSVALSLAPMAVIGGYLGAWMTEPLQAEHLKRGFGVFLVMVGLKLALFK
jgi:uncharacterized protein